MSPHLRPVDVREPGAAGGGGHLNQFLLQNLEHAPGPGGAEGAQAPARRPSDTDAIGTQSQRLEDVGATADAAIE